MPIGRHLPRQRVRDLVPSLSACVSPPRPLWQAVPPKQLHVRPDDNWAKGHHTQLIDSVLDVVRLVSDTVCELDKKEGMEWLLLPPHCPSMNTRLSYTWEWV